MGETLNYGQEPPSIKFRQDGSLINATFNRDGTVTVQETSEVGVAKTTKTRRLERNQFNLLYGPTSDTQVPTRDVVAESKKLPPTEKKTIRIPEQRKSVGDVALEALKKYQLDNFPNSPNFYTSMYSQAKTKRMLIGFRQSLLEVERYADKEGWATKSEKSPQVNDYINLVRRYNQIAKPLRIEEFYTRMLA